MDFLGHSKHLRVVPPKNVSKNLMLGSEVKLLSFLNQESEALQSIIANVIQRFIEYSEHTIFQSIINTINISKHKFALEQTESTSICQIDITIDNINKQISRLIDVLSQILNGELIMFLKSQNFTSQDLQLFTYIILNSIYSVNEDLQKHSIC